MKLFLEPAARAAIRAARVIGRSGRRQLSRSIRRLLRRWTFATMESFPGPQRLGVDEDSPQFYYGPLTKLADEDFVVVVEVVRLSSGAVVLFEVSWAFAGAAVSPPP